MAWRAIQAGLPKNAIISSDIGNNCAIGNAYPTFEQGGNTWRPACSVPAATAFPDHRRQDRLPDVPVVFCRRRLRHQHERDDRGRPQGNTGDHHGGFRNYQGREKRNSILWYDNNFCRHRTRPAFELRRQDRLEGCGLKGVQVKTQASDRGVARGLQGGEKGRQHLHRSHPQSGNWRAFQGRG